MNELITDVKSLELETLKNLRSSKAQNTLRAYKADYKDFASFCIKNGFKPMPSEPKVITLWKNSNQFNPEAEVTETSPPGRSRRADSDFAIRLPPNPLETSIFEK